MNDEDTIRTSFDAFSGEIHGTAPSRELVYRLQCQKEPFVTEKINDNSDMLIELTVDVVSAYVSNNPVPISELPALIGRVHAALRRATSDARSETPEVFAPAVPVNKSVTPDYIICLEDGKKFKSLKRHLFTHHGLSPGEYRAKWGLSKDYPMVAPNYAAARSALAKSMGLGRKPKAPQKPTEVKRTRKRVGA